METSQFSKYTSGQVSIFSIPQLTLGNVLYTKLFQLFSCMLRLNFSSPICYLDLDFRDKQKNLTSKFINFSSLIKQQKWYIYAKLCCS